MIINHNILSLQVSERLKDKSLKQSKSMEKLSSGLRINRASDDAAGLSISEKLRAQIRGLSQAKNNIQDAISLIQTAEGALSNILDPPLQRMRELAIQSSNDTLTDEDRVHIQKEINQVLREIDDIANNTEFNTQKLINGSNKVTMTSIVQSEKISWTEIDTGSDTNFYDIAWNGSLYLAVGYQGNTLASNDGESWYVPSGSVTNSNLNSIKWDGSRFLISEGGAIYSTTNGVNRTGYSSSIPGINGHFFDVDYVGGKYLAVGDNGQMATTNDPTVNSSWTSLVSGTSEQLLDAASSGDEYVVVGKNGTILRSTDGVNWSTQVSGTTAQLKQVIWENNQYTAVGGSGTILTSSDGITWDKQNTPGGINVIYDIVYNGDEYVAVSNNGWVLNSKDGINWNGEQLQGNPYLQGIVFDGNDYLAIGWEGKALKGTRPTTAKTTVLQQNVNIQVGANKGDSMSIELCDVRTQALDIADINVLSSTDRFDSIARLDRAIAKVSSERTKFGSYQNRLEYTLENTSNYGENLSASEARIRDVDMAKEIMNQTKNSILAQASQSILAQANQQPENILQLLK
ncbi:flagellin N-terminal helical domain-containing protein [Metabacillus litoralis]|uniref:flagellin N-terminal helical domain-containing protein n=1 Tax=Metabacillus litoralis TaxID=152268 RepID=UPI000EF60AD8|nr:flagellin [Metabacillus litoralis]